MPVPHALLLTVLSPALQTGTPLALERIAGPDPDLVQATDVCVPPAGAPGDRDLFLSLRDGRIVVLRDGDVLPSPFVDIGVVVETGGDVGLRSFQFHPDYASNGQVFVWYDAANGTPGVDGVLARMERSSSNPLELDLSTYIEILRVPQDGRSHGGGALEFDADGMLVLGIGDGEPGGDPNCRAQDPSNLLGAMLRIDVDGGFPYRIPQDNPFVGVAGHAPEILHFGLRHPWKWDIDEADGSLWIADVGQVVAEEIDYVPPGVKGLNFGWSVLEGTDCFAHAAGCPGGVETDCASTAFTAPVFEYGHGLGCSVTGASVYRGALLPELDGRYVFTDFCSKRVWSTERDPQTGTFTTVEHPITRYPDGSILTLSATCGVDADGELIFPDFVDGEIYRLTPMSAVEPVCDGMPNRTGASADLSYIGSTSYAASDVRLRVDQAPPQSLSVLFYGFDAGQMPLGNGVLCVAPNPGPLVRVDYRLSNTSGVILYDVESDDPALLFGGVTVGTTCIFQSWYRDVNGPLGFDTNTSSALSVRFRP